MSVLASFQGAIGGGTGLYRVSRRDHARGRRYNVTTSTWKSTVASGDAQQTLVENTTIRKGFYFASTSGMGAPGVVYRYVHNVASGRVVQILRESISDGSFANTPDAADLTNANKARLEVFTTVPGAGNSRYFSKAEDTVLGRKWNHAVGAWQSVVSDGDQLIPLAQDPLADYANVYGAFVEGMGTLAGVQFFYYDSLVNAALDSPFRGETVNLSSGSIAASGIGPYKIEAMRAHGVNTVETRLNPTREPVCVLHADPHGSPCLLMRIVDSSGAPITDEQLSSLTYTIYRRSDSDLSLNTHVDGHFNAPLIPADVVLDALQTDYLWGDADDRGYNFRHQLEIASNDALTEYGARYDLVYDFRPMSGQKFPARFQVRT